MERVQTGKDTKPTVQVKNPQIPHSRKGVRSYLRCGCLQTAQCRKASLFSLKVTPASCFKSDYSQPSGRGQLLLINQSELLLHVIKLHAWPSFGNPKVQQSGNAELRMPSIIVVACFSLLEFYLRWPGANQASPGTPSCKQLHPQCATASLLLQSNTCMHSHT